MRFLCVLAVEHLARKRLNKQRDEQSEYGHAFNKLRTGMEVKEKSRRGETWRKRREKVRRITLWNIGPRL